MAISGQHINEIKQKATDLGFLEANFIDLTSISSDFEAFYYSWLKKQYHGEMQYMEKNAKQRFEADLMLQNAQAALVVLAPCSPQKPNLQSRYKISRYSVGLDYHFALKQKLNELLTFIQALYPNAKGRAFTDSAPVPERYLAAKTGMGFIGKNSMLIHPKHGSYTFIGELYLDIKPEHFTEKTSSDNLGFNPEFPNCADCSLCMKACPDGAITASGIVDSKKCISYKTIEYKGEFKEKEPLAGYIFGCDICQQACPYNKGLTENGWEELQPKKEIAELTDEDWHTMGSSKFKHTFSNTVLFRTGLKRLRRNIEQNK